MIQRIQTLWLFLVFLMAALTMFFPLATFHGANGELMKMGIFAVEGAGDIAVPNVSVIGVLVALLAVLGMGNIFQFNNRKRQLKINMVAMLVNMGLVIAIFLLADKIAALDDVLDKYDFEFAAYFPVASVLFLILANRNIRKDEALVKQADRIR